MVAALEGQAAAAAAKAKGMSMANINQRNKGVRARLCSVLLHSLPVTIALAHLVCS